MKAITNILLVLWFILYELLFVAVALLTELNPYVLAALFVAGGGCNVIIARMNNLSPYERPMAFNSEIYTTALSMIGMFSYLPIAVCFFVDWKIALAGLAVGLLLGGFLTFLADTLIAKPLYAVYRILLRLGSKAQ